MIREHIVIHTVEDAIESTAVLCGTSGTELYGFRQSRPRPTAQPKPPAPPPLPCPPAVAEAPAEPMPEVQSAPPIPADPQKEYLAWLRTLTLAERIKHDHGYGKAFFEGSSKHQCQLAGRVAVERRRGSEREARAREQQVERAERAGG